MYSFCTFLARTLEACGSVLVGLFYAFMWLFVPFILAGVVGYVASSDLFLMAALIARIAQAACVAIALLTLVVGGAALGILMFIGFLHEKGFISEEAISREC